MDAKDLSILHILQREGRVPVAAIAEEVGLSAAAVHMRILKLEQSGAIAGYAARLSPEAFGKEVQALLRLQVEHAQDNPEETLARLLSLRGVTGAYTTTGDWDYHAVLFVKDVAELRRVITGKLKEAVPHMVRSDTALILYYKEKPLEV